MRITVVSALAVLAIAGTAPAQEKRKEDKSEQASKAGGLPVGKPGLGMVWVDSKSKIYYRQGHRLYGKSKNGAYMSEGDAVNSGYRDPTQKASKK